MSKNNHDIIIDDTDIEEEVVYFFFSRQQQKELDNHTNTFGGRIVHGTVLVEGSMRMYTEMSTRDDSRYSDAILVAKGLLSDMIYNERVLVGR